MRIHVIGSGLTGITIARALTDKGHAVTIYENAEFGGLCQTREFGGTLYEPYGPHFFHTNDADVWRYVNRFAEWKDLAHTVEAVSANGETYDYPVSRETARQLDCENELNGDSDNRNFETVMIAKLGATLYYNFVYHYTKKQWGVEPRELSAALAGRVELRDKPGPYFLDKYRAYPRAGYTAWLHTMAAGIPIVYHVDPFSLIRDGLIIFTGEIGGLFNNRHGALKYRSIVQYMKVADFDYSDKATTNYCSSEKPYTRKTRYWLAGGGETKIQGTEYSRDGGRPMYPFPSEEEECRFDQYLEDVVKTEIIPAGRLGLYRYMNMDTAIIAAMQIADVAADWPSMDVISRLKTIQSIRGRK